MPTLYTLVTPVLAQGATGALDTTISGMNMSPDRIAIFSLVFGVVVILLVLGTEFWINLFGLFTAPTVVFSRLMGEQQILPALFVVLMSGLLIAVFALMILPTDAYIEKQSDNVAQLFKAISDQFATLGVPYASSAFAFELDDVRLSVMKSLGFFLLVPFTMAIYWYSQGVGFLVAGKLIGMRNAAGVNNVVCGLAWPLALWPILFWSNAQAVIFNNSAAWVLWGLAMLLYIVWTLLLAREFFRVAWVPSIIGTVLGYVIGFVVYVLAFVILVMFYGLLKEQFPQYL